MNPDELKKILDALAQAGVYEFSLSTDDFSLELRRGVPASAEGGQLQEAGAAQEPGPAAPAPLPEPAPAGLPVRAPIVGTFYAASSPGAAPYVQLGDRVEAGQVLCIIEAMKLMNEIEAEEGGVVRQILASDGEPVEYGQTCLLYTSPSPRD